MSQFSVNDPGFAPVINVTTATTIVAAPGVGYRIVVLGCLVSLDAGGDVTWSSASTALTGAQNTAAGTPTGAFSAAGILRCAENEALRLTSTAAANGFVRYVIVNR